MVKVPSGKPRITPATRRRMNLRMELWPDVQESQLWNRAEFTGFTTIPRTLSVIIRAIDDLDTRNAGKVYLDLWCRSFDDYVIEIKDEYEAAFISGYSGQRAIRTWRERIEVLEKYEFVKTHKAPHGAYRYILILEPHQAAKKLKDAEKISSENWSFLTSMLVTIGHNTDFL
jgi:hypothetical protein